MKKIAIVEIKGGLGNQIFQYTFSQYLKKMGFRVFYNLNFYKNKNKLNYRNTKRELLLNELNCDIKNINRIWIYICSFLNFLINSRKIKKYFPIINTYMFKYFKERDFDKNKVINDYALINYFDGYWQMIDYLISEKRELRNKFDLKFSSEIEKNKPPLMIHIRRGDYLKLGIELPIEYYIKALSLLNSEAGNLKYDIFTDDKDWVLKQNIFNNYENVYTDINDPVSTFKQMMNYEHFIIANSTYSFLAAFFGEKNNSKVYTPFIWNKNKGSDFLVNSSWERVKI